MITGLISTVITPEGQHVVPEHSIRLSSGNKAADRPDCMIHRIDFNRSDVRVVVYQTYPQENAQKDVSNKIPTKILSITSSMFKITPKSLLHNIQLPKPSQTVQYQRKTRMANPHLPKNQERSKLYPNHSISCSQTSYLLHPYLPPEVLSNEAHSPSKKPEPKKKEHVVKSCHNEPHESKNYKEQTTNLNPIQRTMPKCL